MAKQGGDSDGFKFDDEAIRELENTIFSARNFVVPSPDLRPRTLEQARDAHRIHVWANRIAVAAFGCMFLWSIAIIATRHLGQYRDKLTGPFPDELEQRAARYPSHDRYGTQWRLVEAFQQERSLQTEDSSVPTRRGPQPGSAKNTF